MNRQNLGLIGFGLAVGVFGGMFGLGGGVIMIPVLLYVYKKDIHSAAATSLAVIGPMAISGTIGTILSGKIVWPAFLLLSAGSVAGAYFGAHYSKLIPRDVLRKMLGIFVVVISLSIIFLPPPARGAGSAWSSPDLLTSLLMTVSRKSSFLHHAVLNTAKLLITNVSLISLLNWHTSSLKSVSSNNVTSLRQN